MRRAVSCSVSKSKNLILNCSANVNFCFSLYLFLYFPRDVGTLFLLEGEGGLLAPGFDVRGSPSLSFGIVEERDGSELKGN